MKNYDVLIIGGGVTGCATARELSKYNLKVAVLEKNADICTGTSKANTGIVHSAANINLDSVKGRLCVAANPVFDELARDLHIPFNRNGSLILAFSREEEQTLHTFCKQGKDHGIPGLELVSREWLLEKEPELNKNVLSGLLAPSGGIICPFELTIALAENAALNGVDFFRGYVANRLLVEDNRIIGVSTSRGDFYAPYVVNAAGLFADTVANLAGDEVVKITPRKGQYFIFDQDYPVTVTHTLFPTPTEASKGILVTPTVHGNLMIGPTAEDIEDKEDLSTTPAGLDQVFSGARHLVPKLERKSIIKMFSGLRAVGGTDFIIKPSPRIYGLVHAAGIQSPGLTSAPKVAEVVAEMLFELGLKKEENAEFVPTRPQPVKLNELTWQEREELITRDPDYGEIICRCETISRGEIRDSILRPVGATTVDGVKRRTRATSGRCQGGFCGPKVVKLLSKYLGRSSLEVTQKGGDSKVLLARAKELLQNAGEAQ